MKTAIYIEDGVTQLVLTPETEHEKNIVKAFGGHLDTVRVFEGTFYDCRGGWVRQSAYRGGDPYRSAFDTPDDVSLIMRVASSDEVIDS